MDNSTGMLAAKLLLSPSYFKILDQTILNESKLLVLVASLY